ncbi:MAG: glycosyltransferase family 4 protein [Candidatus Woesearchaeota archaeon]
MKKKPTITYIVPCSKKRFFIHEERINPFLSEFNFNIVVFDKEIKKLKIIKEKNKSYYIYPLKKTYLNPPLSTLIGIKTCTIMNKFEKETDIFHIAGVDLITGAGMYKLSGGKKPVLARLNSYGLLSPDYSLFYNNKLYLKSSFKIRLNKINSKINNPLLKILSPIYALYFQFDKMYWMRYIEKFHAIDKSVKEYYSSFNNHQIKVPVNKIQVIPNFIDREFIKKSKINIKKDKKFTFIYIGRITENKGIKILVKAFSEEFKNTKNIQLKIIGDGDLKKYVLKNKTDNISFENFIDHNNIYKEYKKANVFIHPTLNPEPFGRTILEALYCDLPVICTDIGAPPNIVGKAGIKIKINSVKSLKKSLKNIYENKKLYNTLRNNCKKEREKYSQEKSDKMLSKLYKEIIYGKI